MSAASEYGLIGLAIDYSLQHAEETEARVIEALQFGAATSSVNALRMLTMHSTIIAIGAIQAFESLIQQKKGWKNTFKELDLELRTKGHTDLADRFLDYRDAINVLKHGEGSSYDKLVARKEKLPFTIKEKGRRYFDEGDVSENIRLVDADHAFVRQCSEIIEEIISALRSTT